ncbi:hydroxycinnamoyl-CoA:piscidic acid hydroxycinnamoyltransferase-like [Gastrolobium bilobum]|uniref:hydroxycinnamoyl-CoA:piscidic acid hydroxycinnamoyltransferase-like n=1 Tax=Gastrolobium bilobum TaxID=150636 RepID=UPI002AB10207|nr:hydroxycinnamoyl-CoA:piscidic acid hydroxycinnamoyltransferase-like [Gastrolobium bilobum]
MVSVQSCYTVTPSEPTPNEKLYSLCEQIKLRTHAPLLFVYKPHGHEKASTFVHILRTSLSKALVIYYPLAGRLSWIEGGQWEIHCNGKGAWLLEANCDEVKNLDDLGDFVPTNLVSKLMPNIDYGVPIEEVPLLVVQLTRFQCGGLVIGVALCRAVIDGIATMHFMRTWAMLARGENVDLKEMPCHDRTLLDSQKLHMGLHEHLEFHPPPPWVGELGDTRVVVVDIVKLTQEQVEKLKKKVNSAYGASAAAPRPCSTFEVIAGHLWRCVSKARYEGNGDQHTRLSTLVNCRNRLRPPFLDCYAGNAAFPTVTPTCSFDDLMQKPLSYAAWNVRKALERVTGEFVRSALGHIENQKDMNMVRNNFHYPATSVHEGPFKGNPNLFVVSWMNFPFEDADFGWGKPVYFGPGFMDSEGKAFIFNNANGNGVIVAISLDSSHMDSFKKLFYDDIEEVFTLSKL